MKVDIKGTIPVKMKPGSSKKIDSIAARIGKRKACGIIYNLPHIIALGTINRLEQKGLIETVNVKENYNSPMILRELARRHKAGKIATANLPAVLDGKTLTLFNADFMQNDFSRFMEQCSRIGVPLLILLKTDAILNTIRGFHSYSRILTIEQDYTEFVSNKN